MSAGGCRMVRASDCTPTAPSARTASGHFITWRELFARPPRTRRLCRRCKRTNWRCRNSTKHPGKYSSEIKISSYQSSAMRAARTFRSQIFSRICGCIRICRRRRFKLAVHEISRTARRAVDVSGRRADRDSLRRGVGPAESFFRRRRQHFHLLRLFCDPTGQPRAGFAAAICPRGWRRGCRTCFSARSDWY